jgi:hypothetical protein
LKSLGAANLDEPQKNVMIDAKLVGVYSLEGIKLA